LYHIFHNNFLLSNLINYNSIDFLVTCSEHSRLKHHTSPVAPPSHSFHRRIIFYEVRKTPFPKITHINNPTIISYDMTFSPLFQIHSTPQFTSPKILRRGTLTLHSIGDVGSYRQWIENVVVPVRFISTRVYWSIQRPRQRCVYVCMTDMCEGEMVFSVVASDMEYPLQYKGCICFEFIFS
jgi:hypothetical protein